MEEKGINGQTMKYREKCRSRTHLSVDLSLESLGERRERALEEKKAVSLVLLSLYSPLFPPFFFCHSLGSATSSLPFSSFK